jgi:hypothetical protein
MSSTGLVTNLVGPPSCAERSTRSHRTRFADERISRIESSNVSTRRGGDTEFVFRGRVSVSRRGYSNFQNTRFVFELE